MQQFFIITLSLCILLAVPGCKDSKAKEEQPQQQAMPVPVGTPIEQEVQEWDEYTGRFQAVDRVEIRARVGGYLQDIRFKDGQDIKKGEILFVIDPRPYEIALQRAEAQLRDARAQSQLARKDLNRFKSLRDSKAISQQEYDARTQANTTALASIGTAKAAVAQARLDLNFSRVKAPISGRISRHLVDQGNLVNDQTLLTTIVSRQPIHFYFEASEGDLLKYIRLDRNGSREGSRTAENPVYAKLLDENDYAHEGHMDFVDNEVDAASGTIEGRAIFANKDGLLEPGMFGRIRLPGSGKYDALLIDDTIIGTNQTQKFVYVVGDNNTVGIQPVTLGPLFEGKRIVRSGLQADTQMITGNVAMLRPGMPIAPQTGEQQAGAPQKAGE